MSDPAENAANRVAMEIGDRIYYHHLLDSAREMAKPIRELHAPGYGYKLPRAEGQPDESFCKHCEVKWPCKTAKLIYSTEELS